MLEEAELSITKSLNVYKKLSIDDKEVEPFIAEANFFIKYVLHAKKRDDPKRSFKKTLQMLSNSVLNLTTASESFASKAYMNGSYLFEKKEFELAEDFFKKSLEIDEQLSLDNEKDNEIAAENFWIGRCLLAVSNPKTGQVFFERAEKIFRSVSDVRPDESVAVASLWSGHCFREMKRLKDSRLMFESAMHIYENLSVDIEFDKNVANLTNLIGSCLIEIKLPKRAQIFFGRALRIYANLSTDVRFDRSVADQFFFASGGVCWI